MPPQGVVWLVNQLTKQFTLGLLKQLIKRPKHLKYPVKKPYFKTFEQNIKPWLCEWTLLQIPAHYGQLKDMKPEGDKCICYCGL